MDRLYKLFLNKFVDHDIQFEHSDQSMLYKSQDQNEKFHVINHPLSKYIYFFSRNKQKITRNILFFLLLNCQSAFASSFFFLNERAEIISLISEKHEREEK
jgi:hypothetical protein